jgi:hypothetical protein
MKISNAQQYSKSLPADRSTNGNKTITFSLADRLLLKTRCTILREMSAHFFRTVVAYMIFPVYLIVFRLTLLLMFRDSLLKNWNCPDLARAF